VQVNSTLIGQERISVEKGRVVCELLVKRPTTADAVSSLILNSFLLMN